MPVEALYPGERVITRDAGAQPLLGITRHAVPAGMRFVHVSRDALGGKPTRDLILPATQKVLLRDWRAQAMFGTSGARVALSRLVDGEHLRWSDCAPRGFAVAGLQARTCALCRRAGGDERARLTARGSPPSAPTRAALRAATLRA